MVEVASSQELVYNIQDLEVKEQTLEQDNTLVHKQATSGLTQMTADATDGWGCEAVFESSGLEYLVMDIGFRRRKKGHKRGSKRKAVEDTLARWKMQNQLEVAANGAEEARKTRPRGSKKGRMLGKGGPDKAVCGYRGARQRRWGKWVAEIREPPQKSSVSKGTKGKRLLLGTFDAAIETALAYDRAARAMYGSGAHRNFPEYSMESLNSPNKALPVVTNRKLEAASTSDSSEEHKVNHHSLLYAPGCSQSPVRGSMKNLDSYGVCADNGLKVESDCYELFVNEELKEEPEDITGEPRGASIDFEVETSVFRKEIGRELEEIEKLCGWYGFNDMNNCLQSELENMGCESRIDCEPFW